MNKSHHRLHVTWPRGLRIVSFLLILSTLAWPAGPLLSTASAEGPAAEPQARIVERWRGTVYEELIATNSYVGCPWVCPGSGHRFQKNDWNLEVDEDGYVRGSIKSELIDDSYQQSETNLLCGPVAETDYFLMACTYAGEITQPLSEVFVEGTRQLNPFTHQPELVLKKPIVLEECKERWTAVGVHSITYEIVHKQEEFDCTTTPSAQAYKIETFANGESPLIPMTISSSWPGGSYSSWGSLIGTPEKPSLALDRELLERSIFLDEVPVEEQFTANTDWASPDGGWVTWQLSDKAPEQVGPTKEAKIPRPMNQGSQGVGRKQLTVQSKNTLQKTSSPQTTQVQVAPPPAWTGAPSQISASKDGGSVRYKSSLKYPDPPFAGKVTVPEGVPFLENKPLGIAETQGTLAWEAQSTSEGQASITGKTGFEAMGGVLGGSLGGHGKVILGASGVEIPEGGLDFGIFGKLKKEEPLLKVVPALRPALTLIEKISSQAAQFIEKRATAKLEIEPRFDFGFNFFTQDGQIKFKNAQVTPGFGLKTTLQLELIEDILYAAASIGGRIAATLQVPAPYFKQAVLDGLAAGKLILYRWTWEGEKAWRVTLSGGSGVASAAADQLAVGNSSSGSWQPLDRSYLDRPNYAQWHGDAPPAQAQAATGDDVLLVQNVFPLANPSLGVWTDAWGNNILVQAWAHDKPGAPAESGGEIAYSMNTGSYWNGPVFLTNDDRDDLAPKAVILPGSNNAMFLWQRMDTATPPAFGDDPAANLSHWQIAARTRLDGAAVPVKQLSTSGSLNYRHQLGATADGALAVWVNNPANQIFGDATHPDQILFARYQQATKTWTVASPVVTELAGLVSLDLATNGQYAALVYSRDMDGDLSTSTDRELFYATWNGSSWSATTRLTDDTIADDDPQLALDANGAPLLVWRQNGAVSFLHGSWSSTPAALDLPGAAERSDFELVRGSDGRLALVWQEVQADVSLVGYAIYDAAQGTWSGQGTLTPPADSGIVKPATSMATGITAALLPPNPKDYDHEVNGHLVLGYQLAHVESVTRTIEGITVANVPQIGQHDLRVASVPLEVNLSVSPADLSLPTADTLQAVIHNTGDLAVQNVPVALHLGSADPVSGATNTVTQTVPLIAARSAATVTYSLAGRSETIFAVQIDPKGTLAESTMADNTAMLGADLAITMLPAYYSPGGTMVRALVSQQSPRYVSLVVTSTLNLDAPDGPVLGWNQIALPITSTTGVEVSTFITPTALGAGRHSLFWTVDPGNTLGETDLRNNVAGTTIMVLPDLAGVDGLAYFGTAPGNTAPFTMTVRNMGNWPSSGGSLEVFDGLPGQPGVHSLVKSSLPSIGPGDQAGIPGTLQLAGLPAAATGLSGIYIQLDPEEVVDESNENNNFVAAGAVLEGTASPALDNKLYLPVLTR